VELSELSDKLLVHLNLDENPLKDSKVKKICLRPHTLVEPEGLMH
jgi:hypothetical protein